MFENATLRKYNERMETLDAKLDKQYKEYERKVERQHKEFMGMLNNTFNERSSKPASNISWMNGVNNGDVELVCCDRTVITLRPRDIEYITRLINTTEYVTISAIGDKLHIYSRFGTYNLGGSIEYGMSTRKYSVRIDKDLANRIFRLYARTPKR